MSKIVLASTSDNIAEQNEKIHNLAEDLHRLLDIHDIYFELGEYDNIVSDDEKELAEKTGVKAKGIALKVVTGWSHTSDSASDKYGNMKNYYIRKDQMSTYKEDRLQKIIAKQNKPLALNEDAETGNIGISPEDMGSYLQSNSMFMHPVGSDIWFFPWDNATGEFAPLTEASEEAIQEIDGANETNGDEGFDEE